MNPPVRVAHDSRRIDALDGLRGFAVLFAFAQHALMMPGAWLSADIFFVLSGFLITGELVRDRNNSNYWTAFLARRAARIVPSLVVTLVMAALLMPVVLKKVGWMYALSGAGVGNLRWGNSARIPLESVDSGDRDTFLSAVAFHREKIHGQTVDLAMCFRVCGRTAGPSRCDVVLPLLSAGVLSDSFPAG